MSFGRLDKLLFPERSNVVRVEKCVRIWRGKDVRFAVEGILIFVVPLGKVSVCP